MVSRKCDIELFEARQNQKKIQNSCHQFNPYSNMSLDTIQVTHFILSRTAVEHELHNYTKYILNATH